jgi:hypothetical protein
VRLSDGAVLKLKILIVDVKEAGFSPFGGVSFDVKVVGGVAVESLPDSVRELIGDKPFAPPETPRRVGRFWISPSSSQRRPSKSPGLLGGISWSGL